MRSTILRTFRSIGRGLPLAGILSVLGAGLAAADADNPLLTDRPTFVQSTGTVGEHCIQVETGVERTQDETGVNALHVWSTPTMVRFGAPNRMELRVQSRAFARVRTFNAVTNGMSDLDIGLKGEAPLTWDPRLSAAWTIGAGLPTGSKTLRNEGVRPEFTLAAAWELLPDTHVGALSGVRVDQNAAGERFATGMLGVKLAHAWVPQFRTYAEVAGRQLRSAEHGGRMMTWDLGAAWQPMPETQLDAAVGFGLQDNDPDLAWTIGVSRRFTLGVPGGAFGHRKDESKPTPSASTEPATGK